MSSRSQTAWQRGMRRAAAASLLLLAGLTLALVSRMLLVPALAGDFLTERAAPLWLAAFLFLHITGGMLALAAGVWNLLAPRPPKGCGVRHRRIGQSYVAGVLASAVGAAGLVPFVTTQWAGHVGIGLLVPLWALSALATASAAKRRDTAEHRRWAIRSFALTAAAISLRVQLLALDLGGVSLADWYGLVMWTCWIPNLVLAEAWLARAR